MMLTGHRQQFGTPITPRRVGGTLKKVEVNTTRDKDQSQRGYYYSVFSHAWKTLKVWQELAKGSITPLPIDTLDGLDTLDTSGGGGNDPTLGF